MDRGACQALVLGVPEFDNRATKHRTQLKAWHRDKWLGLSPRQAAQLLTGRFTEGLQLPLSAQGPPEGFLERKDFSAACSDSGPPSAHPHPPSTVLNSHAFQRFCQQGARPAERPSDNSDKLWGTDLGAGKDKVVQTDWGRGVGVIPPLHVTP